MQAFDLLVFERSKEVDELSSLATPPASSSGSASSAACQNLIYEPEAYSDMIGNLTDEKELSDVSSFLSLLTEGTRAVEAKTNPAGASAQIRKSRRVDRDLYRRYCADGAREVAYSFLLCPWRMGYIAEVVQKARQEQDERMEFEAMQPMPVTFDYATRFIESDDGNPAVWAALTPATGAAEHADELIMSGKLATNEQSVEMADGTLAEVSDPFKAARYVAAMELAHEPRLKQAMRKIYANLAMISTYPTKKGKMEMGEYFHPDFGLQHIRNKPTLFMTVDLWDQDMTQYLRMLKYQRDGLVTISVHLPQLENAMLQSGLGRDGMIGGEKIKTEVDLGPFMAVLSDFYSRSSHGDGDDSMFETDWAEQRSKVLTQCLKQFVLPSLEAELRRDMYKAACDAGVREAAESLRRTAMRGPLRPTQLLGEDLHSKPPGVAYDDDGAPREQGHPFVVGVCVAADSRDATYIVACNKHGVMVDFTPLAPGQRCKDKAKEIAKFFTLYKPELVVVGTSGGVASRSFYRDLDEVCMEAVLEYSNRKNGVYDDDEDDDEEDLEAKIKQRRRETKDEDHGAWNAELTYIDDAVPQLYARSPRSAKEFPEQSTNYRAAVSTARMAINPLAEVAAVWSVASEKGMFGIETFYLNIHKEQKILPKRELLREYERVLVDCVAAVGVDINEAHEHAHIGKMLQFVPGLGPRKAAMLVSGLKSVGGVKSRQDIMMEESLGISTSVFENCAGFLRIKGSSSDDSYDPLDSTRIHPDCYVKFNHARRVVVDTLTDEDGNPPSDSFNSQTQRVMVNSAEDIQRMFEEDKTAHFTMHGSYDEFKAWLWNPFEKEEVLKMSKLAGMIEEDDIVLWKDDVDLLELDK